MKPKPLGAILLGRLKHKFCATTPGLSFEKLARNVFLLGNVRSRVQECGMRAPGNSVANARQRTEQSVREA